MSFIGGEWTNSEIEQMPVRFHVTHFQLFNEDCLVHIACVFTTLMFSHLVFSSSMPEIKESEFKLALLKNLFPTSQQRLVFFSKPLG
jgi:hypothetical protein